MLKNSSKIKYTCIKDTFNKLFWYWYHSK